MKKFKPSDILKPTIVLTAICLVTSALLAITNMATAPVIEALAVETAQQTRKLVLADAAEFTEGKIDEVDYFTGLDESGETVGYVFTTAAKGYGGDVKVMVGVNADGAVSGVQILELSETPGLGMNATKESFLSQFIGKISGITVAKNNPDKNQIQALTGATITSNATTAAVNQALELYNQITGGAK